MELSGNVYVCSYGETFDSVAHDVYGDEIYASDLLCANPGYSDKYTLDAGDRLNLPLVYIPETEEDGEDDADVSTPVTSAPWR